jgi:hypothetical protein
MTQTEAFLMAIEALDNADYHKADEAITAIKAALEAKDEPLAWMVYTQEGQSEFVTDNPAVIHPSQRALPLYASSQRTWVGLTDEEILIMSRYDLEYAALIGEVQRKLKEKNT